MTNEADFPPLSKQLSPQLLSTALTPLMKQYWEIKRQHPDAILFFQVGDFYEMFYEDAEIASKILQIALTSRDKNNPVPLCGIPCHAAAAYISKLIQSGRSVAVCDQGKEMIPSKGTKGGMIQREVARVITPGTVMEPALLAPKENNYLAALKWHFETPLAETRKIGLATLDLSTGAFRNTTLSNGLNALLGELMLISPKEILLPSGLSANISMLQKRWPIRFIPASHFMAESAIGRLKLHFKVYSISAIGGEEEGLIAAGAILGSVSETQKSPLQHIVALRPLIAAETLRVHPLAQHHLKLVPVGQENPEATLFCHLDQTMTAMGGRFLRAAILRPLISVEKIQRRQEAVAFFLEDFALRLHLRKWLNDMPDMERLIGRIGLKASPVHDLIALKNAIALLPKIEALFSSQTIPAVAPIHEMWDNLELPYQMIDEALVPHPPLSLKEGGIIKEGFLPALDELRRFQKEGRGMLLEIERAERVRTGIESLKVRYNNIFGYYIEVSETQLKKVPPDYMRKQTLTRAERFTTTALKALEEKMMGAEEEIEAMEGAALETLRTAITAHSEAIQKMAHKIAKLDFLSALAEVAHRNHYCRPEVNEGYTIRIVEGRHPVLEQLRKGFVSNNTFLNKEDACLLILTGPNMAGKSTYMRQVALIVLMAQMGSFVPAKEAQIGVIDQLFTRVGAQDDLADGMSTFMVEMTEVAAILNQATPKSLILLDEIGRGTSTFDGISIAWAIAEYIHLGPLKARTLCATHYHELTQLAALHRGIRNYHMLVREWNDEIIFLRKIVEGGGDKSYGIQVARLAGLSSEIIERAKGVLKGLEAQAVQVGHETGQIGDAIPISSTAGDTPQMENFVVAILREINPLRTTPLDAHRILAELCERVKCESEMT